MSRIMQAREDEDAALERRLSAELLRSVRPVIRRAVGKCLSFAGTLSPEDLEQVAVMAVLRTVDKFDPTRGRQSFGEVAYFRARTACEQYARLHASDVHPSDGAHKGRTVRSTTCTGSNAIRVQRIDIPSHFSDGALGCDPLVDALEAALGERSGRDADDETPEAMLLAAERRALVFEAVRQLASEQRELVSRVFGINRPAQSVRSVAEAWGAPKSRVDRMLARTLVELRELFVDARE
ncbi:sigma-70 family RNA polymerase sigma factor [Myxococcus llanfairpwllgwyngyllgogerychwyrndrobwllllantysiliogogogochensis]|uniref:Sigma-70 family RNA polymerase sigma factor n=1 Tax=Myxococcus llanfairpwllgwyngyllgogerychwyrndrobwllllantysiliogogogochensis TaxID=2590453 RepID=A0A540WZ17_9BACT|nr:sigma-70 family RNA polymerase sigma factor [Myxococcus llanfairpwllgwyngyllgogerychwyrndrobwllllantysiliogogogochensis]TQF14237.1 sigma-70 family RNA polymerase sigma factor [Myxococcus llanfairpwllgwyngyllgogerychwyrndrobwllllantysiliogogogochensis]